MIRYLICLTVFQLSFAQSPPLKPEERCTVQGNVFHAITGEPLRKANVTLRRAAEAGRAPGMGGPGGGSSYAAVTDAAGHFQISDIEPGKYRLFAERAGFVDQWYGAKAPNQTGSLITLEKSQRMG